MKTKKVLEKSQNQTKKPKRGKINTPIHKYMTAHFPRLGQALQ